MELWQFYINAWEAERALKAAVPTAWLVKGGVAFAVVEFPRETEPGWRWEGRRWRARPWIFENGISGVEVDIEGFRFTAVACPQHNEVLTEVEEVHILLNTEPVVGFRLHDDIAEWLRGWAQVLRDKAVKKKAVERARRTEVCRL